MKYTSMTRDEVFDLNDALKKMDTKTARTEPNALAADAGRLGITAKKDILDFVQAADIIKVSLGEDLGEDAIKNIGKLAQIFGNDKGMGLKNAMLATGSAINDIAQSSSASEPYLVEFTSRMAGVGKQADISIAKLIGFASVMDQNAMNVETASTALQAVIMKMCQDPAKMARIAGMEIKSFSKLVKEDANEAVLQLLTTLSKKGGMDSLAPVFKAMKLNGAEASKALSILAADIDKVRGQQAQATIAFEKGTSVIDEFNVKNNDLSAQMEKGKKVLQERVYDLGEQLLPVMLKLVSAGGMTLGMLGNVLALAMKYSGVLIVLGASLVAYNVAIKAGIVLQLISNGLKKAAATFALLHAAAVANSTGNLIRYNAAMKLYNALFAQNSLIVKACTATTYLFTAAKAMLTGNIQKATIAMKAFNAITKLNPIGLLATGITLLISGMVLLNKTIDRGINKQKAMNEIASKANEQTTKEVNRLNANVLNNSAKPYNERKKALEEIQKIVPEYQASLTKEGKLINNNSQALDVYVEKLKISAKQQLTNSKLAEASQNLSNYMKDLGSDIYHF
ncbi:hypothetical protein EZS27_031306 [termite gut metagenome]|uniref:Phage tail tape measure protein domain-containing protein n=1 Tax=termite gut metagenome TaxID=433724 RepID=A0A5J4QDR6_9ZZZZ